MGLPWVREEPESFGVKVRIVYCLFPAPLLLTSPPSESSSSLLLPLVKEKAHLLSLPRRHLAWDKGRKAVCIGGVVGSPRPYLTNNRLSVFIAGPQPDWIAGTLSRPR